MDIAQHFSVFTHNGSITMRNPATDGHRTFRIHTQPDDARFAPGERIVSLLVGPDNTTDYNGFGFVKKDRIVLWRRFRDSSDFTKYADMLQRPNHYQEEHGIEYLYEGKCRRCNRTLTVPESIESGIGPVCAGKV